MGAVSVAETSEKPNFVVIFCDDVDYQDLSCFGSPNIKTGPSSHIASTLDLLPTFAAMAGAKTSSGNTIDGVNVTSLITEEHPKA
jgi:arylsulfatase A